MIYKGLECQSHFVSTVPVHNFGVWSFSFERHTTFFLSKSQTLIQSFRTSKCSKRMRKMKPFLSNITSLLIFLACTLVTVFGQRSSVCDTDPDVVGYSTIEDMNLDMQDLVGDNVFRQFPWTIFIVTEPLTPIVNNTIFTCGVNNSVEDECVFDGGSEQVLIEAILENVSFEGLTFQNFNETSIGAFAPTTSVVTFTNCIWTVSVCCFRKCVSRFCLYPESHVWTCYIDTSELLYYFYHLNDIRRGHEASNEGLFARHSHVGKWLFRSCL